MAAPTPVSSLVHSSTLVTAGIYLIIRFNYYYQSGELSLVLLVLSAMTMLISGLGANFEFDIKKIIALSTLRQLGVIIIRLSLGFYELAFFHLLTHAVFKAILFLCAGRVIHNWKGAQDIRLIGAFFLVSPVLAGIISLARLSLSGFVFLRGFYSKDAILEGVYFLNNSFVLLLIILGATFLTVSYSLRLRWYVFWAGTASNPEILITKASFMITPILIIGYFVCFLGSRFY